MKIFLTKYHMLYLELDGEDLNDGYVAEGLIRIGMFNDRIPPTLMIVAHTVIFRSMWRSEILKGKTSSLLTIDEDSVEYFMDLIPKNRIHELCLLLKILH